MELNDNTKLTDILAKYPWLPDELIKMDGRFKIVKTPVGKMMIKNATIADMSRKTGISEQDLLQKLQEIVAAHQP